MIKKILLIVIMGLLMGMPKSVNAQETEPYVPPVIVDEFRYIYTVKCAISSNNGKVYPSAVISAQNSYDISAKITLQVQSGTSWANVKSWTDSTHGTTLSMDKNASCIKGRFYRAVCKATVNGESAQSTSATIAGK